MEIYVRKTKENFFKKFFNLKGILITGAILIVALSSIIYIYYFSSVFKIKNINFYSKNEFYRADIENEIKELIKRKHFYLWRNLIADNILSWSLKDKDYSLLIEKFPFISEIKIEQDYVKKDVSIFITEKEKIGIWCNSNTDIASEKCFWFDKNGFTFFEAPVVEGMLINKIKDFSGDSLNLGDRVIEEKFLSNIFSIFDILEESELGVRALKIKKRELQEIETNDGFTPKIYFSLRNNPAFSLEVIKSLKSEGIDKYSYIDLRVQNRAYYK